MIIVYRFTMILFGAPKYKSKGSAKVSSGMAQKPKDFIVFRANLSFVPRIYGSLNL